MIMQEINFEIVTWKEIYNMLLDLAEKIQKDKFKPEIIIGIARGGWIPARVLSDLLNNPNIASIKTEFYIGFTKYLDGIKITQPISIDITNKKILIGDEIADSGKSLKKVIENLSEHGAMEIKIATIYCKPWSEIIPNYYEKITQKWIVFPWEIKETIEKIKKRFKKKEETKVNIEELIKAGIPAELVERLSKRC